MRAGETLGLNESFQYDDLNRVTQYAIVGGPVVEEFSKGSFALATAASAIVGGIGFVLGGGKFENGAVTGAFAYIAGRAMGNGPESSEENTYANTSEDGLVRVAGSGQIMNDASVVDGASTIRPHAYDDPENLVGPNRYGKGQCVDLLKSPGVLGAPAVGKGWYKGVQLSCSTIDGIPRGTAIGSGWTKDGKFPMGSTGQHAGLLGDHDANGYHIIEQYKSSAGVVDWYMRWQGSGSDYFHNPRSYSVIEW